MNEGVEILLSRMDSHPEEFEMDYATDMHGVISTSDRWGHILVRVQQRMDQIIASGTNANTQLGYNTRALPFLSDEEVVQVYEKWASLQGPAFTREVMRRLLEDKKNTFTEVAVNTNAQLGHGYAMKALKKYRASKITP